ncbi:MAG: hypothetical protein IID46_13985 [Planctomycetes bacterium]|nr:hypothetical protein [Planctomycetota bacterium]
MSHPDMLTALRPVVYSLQRMNVRYFVGGSVASSVYGVGRTTLDVDLVAELSLEQIAPLVEDLKDAFYISENMIRDAVKRQSCFNVIHLGTMFKVDIFIPKTRQFDRYAISRIRKDTLGFDESEMEVFVASPEDVILNKLDWYRKGDEVAQRQWDDVIGVMKIQKKTLDFDYLQKWAGELNVSDLLERVISEASLNDSH